MSEICDLPCEPISASSPQLGIISPDAWPKLPPPQLSRWQLVLSPRDMKRVYSFLLRATFCIFGHYVPTILFSRLNNTKSFRFSLQLMIPGPPASLALWILSIWYISFLNHHFQSRICFVCKDDMHMFLFRSHSISKPNVSLLFC